MCTRFSLKPQIHTRSWKPPLYDLFYMRRFMYIDA